MERSRRLTDSARAMLPWRVLVVCYYLLATYWTQAARLVRNKRTVIGDYPLCPVGCTSCSSVNGCVTCREGLFLWLQRAGPRQTGVCVAECPPQYYGFNKDQFALCRKCPQPYCETCTDDVTCTSCKSPAVLYDGQCTLSCPVGLYHAAYINQCVQTVDCLQSDWSGWSPCKRDGQTCGYKYGNQFRIRETLQDPDEGGKPCDVTEESRRCRLLYRYCSDVNTNSSDPPQRLCPTTKSDIRRWRKRRGKLPKKCRKKYKQRQRKLKKDKNKGKKKKSRGQGGKKKKKDRERGRDSDYPRFDDRERLASSRHVKNLFLYSPNLRTNRLDLPLLG